MDEISDVAVIGGGIMGLSAALELRRRGHGVTVIDRGRAMAEASGVNAGSLGVQNKLLALLPYAREALALWSGMAAHLGRDVGFRRAGGWRVATGAEDEALLRRSADAQAAAGIALTWHGGNELRTAAPFLGPEVVAATYSAEDCYANPLLFAAALRDAAEAAGVSLIENRAVRGLTKAGRWRLETDTEPLEAERVLVAAGAWSARLLAPLGHDLPLALDVNMITVTEPAPRLMEGIVFHARGILTVKQSGNGSCLIGGGWQGRGDLDSGAKDLDYESALHNLRLASRVIPALQGLGILRQWSGFEGVTPDSLPYLGALGEGLFVCACARGGWTLGPLLGRLAGAITSQGRADLPTAPFAPLRHARERRVA